MSTAIFTNEGICLDVSVKTDDGDLTDRLALFGETVNPIQVTWIPIDVPEFPAQIVDAEQYMGGLERLAAYRGSGSRASGRRCSTRKLAWKAPDFVHILLRRSNKYANIMSCTPAPTTKSISGIGTCRRCSMPMGGRDQAAMPLAGERTPLAPQSSTCTRLHARSALKKAHILNVHEVGHLFDLFHVPACGREDQWSAAGYPYEEGALGPARSWGFLLSRFVDDRDLDILDFMSKCGLHGGVSDFSYQLMALYRQSPQASGTCANPRDGRDAATTKGHVPVLGAKSAAVSGSPASLAVTGAVSADGIASISMAQPTDNAPWAVPGEGEFTLEILDAGGSVLHSQFVHAASRVDHGHGEASWSARVPYFEDANTVILRDGAPQVRASFEIRR